MIPSAYIAQLHRYGLSPEEVEQNLASVRTLERWLEKRGSSLDSASLREIRLYLKRLIRRDENSFNDLFYLLSYYEYSNRVDLDVYLNDVIRGTLNIEDIYDRVTKSAGFDAAWHLEHNVPQPPLGTDPMRLPQYTARLVRRLLADLPRDEVIRVLEDENELLLPFMYDTERELYRAADSLDDYLLASAQLELLKYRALQRHESKWREVCVPDEYIDRAAAFQEILSGVRRGNRLYVTLKPSLPAYYMRADTPEKRRYYACQDSNIRASFLIGKPDIPIVWCERCVSRCRRKFEYLLGHPLSAELVESALLGDTSCRIAVLLGEEAEQ